MARKSFKIDSFKFLGWVFILLVIGCIAFFIFLPNYTRLKNLKHENTRLENEIKMLQDEIDRLEDNSRRLTTDPSLWERMARQQIGVVKEGEIVVDIKEAEE